jgi:hypothetical protein
MANPRRYGTVTAGLNPGGRNYEITWDDGTIDYSDLRQSGWRFEANEAEFAEVEMDQNGFFARCEDCEWDSPYCSGRDSAGREAQAHDSLFHA